MPVRVRRGPVKEKSRKKRIATIGKQNETNGHTKRAKRGGGYMYIYIYIYINIYIYIYIYTYIYIYIIYYYIYVLHKRIV